LCNIVTFHLKSKYYIIFLFVGHEGYWEWSHSGEAHDDAYWGSNSPITSAANPEDCGVMVVEPTHWWWRDTTCCSTTTVDNKRVAPICQQGQQDGKACPDGWTPFEGHCYLVGVTGVTQETAEKDCMSKGGHLASVHSEDENTFIHNLKLGVEVAFWLGATDADVEVIINKHTL
jgi:hypothetical protein